MILSNFHTHTDFCDGLSSAREQVEAALSFGFHTLGFSGHGYVPFEGLYAGMTPDATRRYREAVNELKNLYAGRLNIFTGLENDSVNMQPAGDYDYTIGSVHCIKCGDKYYSVDSREETVARAVENEFGGDGLAFASAYFKAVEKFVSEKRADILGHIDLVRRFNAKPFFDTNNPEYRRAASTALERAVSAGYIVEASTAPLQKGISDELYPACFLLEQAAELGARVIVNSDAHVAANLNFAFDRAEEILRAAGFKERWELTPDGFMPVDI